MGRFHRLKLAILSDTRRPTRADGHHGLGKTVHDIATGLAKRGHDVTLFAAQGSEFDKFVEVRSEGHGALIIESMLPRLDAVLDSTHTHLLARLHNVPVVHRVADMEMKTTPQNAVVESRYMQTMHPTAEIIRKGINVKQIPFVTKIKEPYLIYMSQLIAWKGFDKAGIVNHRLDIPLHFAGRNSYGVEGIPNYHGVVEGRDKWRLLGRALGYVHLSSGGDASPRTPLEAAACGTPTLCLTGDGAQEHVKDGVSGLICEDLDTLIDVAPALVDLNRAEVREWVAETHPLDAMIDAYEDALKRVAEGERW